MLHPYFISYVKGKLLPGFQATSVRFSPKVRLEDIIVQAKHQAAIGSAQCCVIIQSGDPLIPATTVHTLVFVDRHD
jgi:hypothetical protein